MKNKSYRKLFWKRNRLLVVVAKMSAIQSRQLPRSFMDYAHSGVDQYYTIMVDLEKVTVK